MLVYFAGPLFSEAEKRFNLGLAHHLEKTGFSVFLPQRDGVEGSKPPYDRMGREERRRAMFELDKQKVSRPTCSCSCSTEGCRTRGPASSWAWAYAHKELHGGGKMLVGLHTDARAAFVGSKLNPMVRVPLDHVAEDEEELLRVLEGYRPSG